MALHMGGYARAWPSNSHVTIPLHTTTRICMLSIDRAGLVAKETQAELLVLLTDVQGVYDKPPSQPDAKQVSIYRREYCPAIGDKSAQGRGGMQAKIDAAMAAVKGGVPSVVIASGHEPGVIGKVRRGGIACPWLCIRVGLNQRHHHAHSTITGGGRAAQGHALLAGGALPPGGGLGRGAQRQRGPRRDGAGRLGQRPGPGGGARGGKGL